MYISQNSNRMFTSNIFKVIFLLSSKLLRSYSIQGMNFYQCSINLRYGFRLLMKNDVDMNTFLVRNIETGTNWFNLGHWDGITKTGIVLAKSGQLECLQKQVTRNMTGNPVKYLNVFASQQKTKTVATLFLYILPKLNKTSFFRYFGHVWLSSKIDNPTCRSFDLDCYWWTS